MAANGLLAADLLLSTPSIVEPIQNLDDGAWQEWLLGLFLASEDRVGELEEGPGCIKIGLSLTFGIGLGGASLVSMVLVGLCLLRVEERRTGTLNLDWECFDLFFGLNCLGTRLGGMPSSERPP